MANKERLRAKFYLCRKCGKLKPADDGFRIKDGRRPEEGRVARAWSCIECEEAVKLRVAHNAATKEERRKKSKEGFYAYQKALWDEDRRLREEAARGRLTPAERRKRQAESEKRMDERILEARKLGLSYGQYVAMLRRKAVGGAVG